MSFNFVAGTEVLKIRSQEELNEVSSTCAKQIVVTTYKERPPIIVRKKYCLPIAFVGDGWVRAEGDADVIVCDNVQCGVFDTASVKAYDDSFVTAKGRSVVRAYDYSDVTCLDNSQCVAFHNASVRACDKSTVCGEGHASITTVGTRVDVSIYDCAYCKSEN